MDGFELSGVRVRRLVGVWDGFRQDAWQEKLTDT
jgi:hypothetical protein